MKLILISTLFAAVLVGTSLGQTCSDFLTCMPNKDNADTMEKVCSEARKSLNCLETVLDDCKKKMGDNAAMDSVDNMISAQRQTISEQCGCSAIQMSFFTLMAALLFYMFL